jgi:hypothetical protein
MYSPAFAHPFEEHYAARFLCIADVEESIELSQQELPDDSGASLVYAGYPYDPYA